MGSDHEHSHGSCNHDHGDNHGHDHGASSHDHGDHGHGDDHGHHGGEEFVPTGSVHDQFLLLCAAVAGIGLCWLMYFWMTSVPLAAVAEHEGGGEAVHGAMPEESGPGNLGKEVEPSTASPSAEEGVHSGKAPAEGANTGSETGH